MNILIFFTVLLIAVFDVVITNVKSVNNNRDNMLIPQTKKSEVHKRLAEQKFINSTFNDKVYPGQLPHFMEHRSPAMVMVQKYENPVIIPHLNKLRSMKHAYLPGSFHKQQMPDDNEFLNAFGVGVVTGLGVINIVATILKIILVPLMVAKLIALFLILYTPVPVFRNRKMIMASSFLTVRKNIKRKLEERLQNITQKLPELELDQL